MAVEFLGISWSGFWNAIKTGIAIAINITGLWDRQRGGRLSPMDQYTLAGFEVIDFITGTFRDWFGAWQSPIETSLPYLRDQISPWYQVNHFNIDQFVRMSRDSFLPWYLRYASPLTDFMNAFPSGLTFFWGQWGNPLTNMLPVMNQEIIPFWGDVGGALKQIGGFFWDIAKFTVKWSWVAVDAVVAWVSVVWKPIYEAIWGIVEAGSKWAGTVMKPIWNALEGGIKNLVDYFSPAIMTVWKTLQPIMTDINNALNTVEGGINRIVGVIERFQATLDESIFGKVIQIRGKIDLAVVQVANVVGIFSKQKADEFRSWYNDKMDMAFSDVDVLDLIIKAKVLKIKNAMLDVSDMYVGAVSRTVADISGIADQVKGVTDYVFAEGRRIAETPLAESLFTYQASAAGALFSVREYRPSTWRPNPVDEDKLPDFMQASLLNLVSWDTGPWKSVARYIDNAREKLETTGQLPDETFIFAPVNIVGVIAHRVNTDLENMANAIGREIESKGGNFYRLHKDAIIDTWGNILEAIDTADDRLAGVFALVRNLVGEASEQNPAAAAGKLNAATQALEQVLSTVKED